MTEDGVEIVLRKYLPAMQRIAASFAREDPEDLVHDAIVRLLCSNSFDPEKATISYFYKTIRHTSLQRFAAQKQQRQTMDELQLRASMGMPPQDRYGSKEPRRYRPAFTVTAPLTREQERAHKLAINSIALRIDQHKKRCLECGRGIPDPLNYCSSSCERMGRSRPAHEPAIKHKRKGRPSRFAVELWPLETNAAT